MRFHAGLSPAHQKAAEHAKRALLDACAATPLDWSEFEEVSLTTSNASGYLKYDLDWDLKVTISFLYKEGLDRRRGGHRLTFDFGAGKRPGIVTRKSHAIRLCGFEGRARGMASKKPCNPDVAEDCILEVPALKVLDADRPSAIVESEKTGPVAWCFAQGFDPPEFWNCRPTVKLCNKVRAKEKRENNEDFQVRSECSRAENLHCFTGEIGQVSCTPDAATCVISRKTWTDVGTATLCEVGTPEMLAASVRKD